MKYWQKALILFGVTLPLISNAKNYFPNNQFSIGFYNQKFIHLKFPTLPKPLFWNSRYKVDSGFMLSYLHTRFHTGKYFSVSLGFTASDWQSGAQHLFALSALFELRWWVFRSKYISPYLLYSIAGPTILSKSYFAGSKLGGHLIFQDYMGAGIMLGHKYHFTLEAKIVHYSNGDLGVYNKGLQVPFLISIGFLS